MVAAGDAGRAGCGRGARDHLRAGAVGSPQVLRNVSTASSSSLCFVYAAVCAAVCGAAQCEAACNVAAAAPCFLSGEQECGVCGGHSMVRSFPQPTLHSCHLHMSWQVRKAGARQVCGVPRHGALLQQGAPSNTVQPCVGAIFTFLAGLCSRLWTAWQFILVQRLQTPVLLPVLIVGKSAGLWSRRSTGWQRTVPWCAPSARCNTPAGQHAQ